MFHLHDILMATGGCWPASNFTVVKSSALKLAFLNEKLTFVWYLRKWYSTSGEILAFYGSKEFIYLGTIMCVTYWRSKL